MKHKTSRTIVCLAVAVSTAACGGPKSAMVPILRQAAYRVAVLTFTSSGFLASQKPGKFAADELAKTLVLRKRAVVVDRSLVNAATARIGITSANFLTHTQLKALAEALNVQLIVLGEVQNIGRSLEDLSRTKTALLLTYRILDPDSGTLLGLVSHNSETRGDPKQLLIEMTDQMVKKLDALSLPARLTKANSGSASQADSTAALVRAPGPVPKNPNALKGNAVNKGEQRQRRKRK